MEWYDPIIEEFIDELSGIGIDIDAENVKFSGFWSQGDGASFDFDSRDCDNKKFIKFLIQHQGLTLTNIAVPNGGLSPESLETLCELTGEISIGQFMKEYADAFLIFSERNSNRYFHENTCQMVVDFDWLTATEDAVGNRNFDQWCEEIEAVAEKWRIQECKSLFRRLEKWYEESGQTDEE